MRVLALDAAFGPGSAAIVDAGDATDRLGRVYTTGSSAGLPEAVAAVLAGSDVFDAVAVTVGPGSFTGIRAGLALAHGLALGAGVPVVGISTIEALIERFTQSAPEQSTAAVWVAIDDRRGRCFLARAGEAVEVADYVALPHPDQPITVIGDAAERVATALNEAGFDVTPLSLAAIDAVQVGRIGARRACGVIAALPPQPWYLEPPEVRLGRAARPAPA